MLDNPELIVGLAAAAGAMAGQAMSWAVKLIDALVRGTPTKLDDKVWAAVHGAMSEALEEIYPPFESEDEIPLRDGTLPSEL